MPLIRTARGARRRGASRRRPPRRPGRGDIDRWLDRLVDIAVITAMAVGAVALVLTLLL
ncbi:hypothetical protein [Halomonas sp. C05BenzN]|uniref:hypothetical protein n=1 Tax=Halomonas sp. C05BenzN TaxID=3411041 RepID=UPI003B96049A